MNIFILDKDPVEAAKMMCDKHVVKMVLETAQMLCAAFPDNMAPYSRTHYNHPCTVWSRVSVQNYEWLLKHGYALAFEYTARYGKIHASQRIIEWCDDNYKTLDLPDIGLTPFAQAMPDMYKSDDPVEAYRKYYKGDKRAFAKWKYSSTPDWWEET